MILKITMGLPGAGKTDWAKKQSASPSKYDRRNSRVDFDLYTTKKVTLERITAEIQQSVRYSYNETCTIDGMFLTYDDVERLLNLLDKADWSYIKGIELEWWKPDVEKCLANDKGRREQHSEITIRNAQLENVDLAFIMKLEEKFPKMKDKIKMNQHTTIQKPDWKVFGETHELYMDEDGKVKGESWCLGGDWRNCWGGGGSVSGEAQPDGFRELDELLEKICPNITFLQYKGIYNEIVSTDEYGDSDYYGGSTSYAYKYFMVENLYNALKKRELIGN